MRQAREKKNGSGKMHFEREIRWKRRGHYLNIYMNNSDYLQKARKYGHFTGYKN